MNIRPKNNSKRKDSHSREHHSNLRSHSRSTDKNKQRSNSKFIKFKTAQHLHENTLDNDPSYNVLNRLALKKNNSSKQIDTSNEYYSHFKGKSKSKGKINPQIDETSKVKYINSIYMHKDALHNQSVSQMEHSAKNIDPTSTADKQQAFSNHSLLNKIKMLERNCGIDANGKIIPKDTVKPQYYDNSKNMDSQNTISMFEGEKKKQKRKVREKTRKDILKGAKSKRDERCSELAKIVTVKSSQKCMKKKQAKDLFSPSCLDKAERYGQVETIQNAQLLKMKDKIRQNSKVMSLSRTNNKTFLLQETRTSPNQEIEESTPKVYNIDYNDIIREIEEDRQPNISYQKLKLVYGSELVQERGRCIEFIGKLCNNFSMRREAHSLAIYFMDRYMLILGKEVTGKQLKLIAMTALLLGLKIDDGIMSRKLCHEYINHMECVLQLASRTDHRDKSTQKGKQITSAFSSKQSSGSVSKSKSQSNISELGVARQDIRKSRKQQIVHSKEMSLILSLELDMMMKFNFKLITRSSTYWVDILTNLWDEYISEDLTWEDQLTFRQEKSKRSISHLFQILEKCFLFTEVYQYSVPNLVLSAMYLIIRMQLEEQKDKLSDKKIYAKFSEQLGKSSNLIFYDSIGVNELFGDFLESLEMNISNLIESIRFVGKHLDQNLKTYAFNAKNKYIDRRNLEHQLSIYQANTQIYKMLEK